MDCSPSGSSVHGIFQARILEWVVIPFSRGSSWLRDWTQASCIAGQFFNIWATLYQLSHKGSPSILAWVAYPFSSRSSWPMNRTGVSALQADSLPAELSGKPILLPKLDLKIYFLEDCFLWPPVIFRSAVKHVHDTCSSLVASITIETNVSSFDIHLSSPWSLSPMKTESGLTWRAIHPHYCAHCQGLTAHTEQVLTEWMRAHKWA